MTDKLKQAAEMALDAIDEGWLFEDIDKTVAPALRQALAEWTPDDTAYRPDGLSQEELPPVKSYCGGKPNYCEPEMPVDRGAWSDVEDATKWVDELRGDEPKREWVSLTEEEIYPMYCEPRSDAEMIAFARELEAKLKEKNNG